VAARFEASVWGGLVAWIVCGLESRRWRGWPFLVIVVCCQVEVSASGWSLVQKSPAECGVPNSVIVKPRRGGPGPLEAFTPIKTFEIPACFEPCGFIIRQYAYQIIFYGLPDDDPIGIETTKNQYFNVIL
jgi:hypothetical protein